jgi:DNA-binding IclR family transcriptional regulator
MTSAEAIGDQRQQQSVRPLGSVDKALVLVETLLAVGGRSSLAQLSRHSGLPKSTAHRLLCVLEAHGMVTRTSEGYRLGELAWRPAGWRGGDQRGQLVRYTRPHLVELAAATGQVVSLVVLDGLDARCADSVYDHNHLDLVARTSDAVPAHASAAGKLLLALDSAAGEQVLRQPRLVGLTAHTITSPWLLAGELARIRDSGIARMRQECLTGAVGLAAAVANARGDVVAAVSVAGPVGGFDWAGVERALRRTVHATSTTLRRHLPGISGGSNRRHVGPPGR